MLLALLLSVLTLKAPGTGDVRIFEHWMRLLADSDIRLTLEQVDDNYPPLSFALLDFIRVVSKAAGLTNFLGLKIALLAALFAVSGIVLAWTRDLAITTALHLALTVSVALGYLDVFWIVPALLSLWALSKERYWVFGALFAVAIMIKPQPLVMLPFLAIHLAGIQERLRVREIAQGAKNVLAGVLRRRREIIQAAVGGLAVVAVCVAAFGILTFLPLWNAMDTVQYSRNRMISGNALNLNWIVTHALHVLDPAQFGGLRDGLARAIDDAPLRYQIVQKVLFAAFLLGVLVRYLAVPKTFRNLLLHAAAGLLTYFILNTGVHENHLVLAPLLLALVAAADRRHLFTFATWSIASAANLIVYYGVSGPPVFPRFIGVDAALVFSGAFVLCYVAFLVHDLGLGEPS